MRVKSQRRTSLSDSTISCQRKFASDACGALPGRRAWMKAFSFSVSHFAVAGKSGSRNQTTKPNAIVTTPSKINSHCQPDIPWAPL
nr:hypothetical protein [Tanacetum cinerariifolium]